MSGALSFLDFILKRKETTRATYQTKPMPTSMPSKMLLLSSKSKANVRIVLLGNRSSLMQQEYARGFFVNLSFDAFYYKK